MRRVILGALLIGIALVGTGCVFAVGGDDGEGYSHGLEKRVSKLEKRVSELEERVP